MGTLAFAFVSVFFLIYFANQGRCDAGLGNQPNMRGDDPVDSDDRGWRRGVLPVRGLVLLRLRLLLLHYADDDRVRRHGRPAEGQRPRQQARVRHVRPDLHPLRPGDRRRLPQSSRPQIRHYEHRG